MNPAVVMTGIGKRFGSVAALDDVPLKVREGAIHAVVGENGAGKTTLMRVLYGALKPDHGSLFVRGDDRTGWNTVGAIAAGVGMVSQHYSIIPELTCLENLILGAEPAPFFAPRHLEPKAEALAQEMGFRFDWNRPAADLSPAGAQKLEILKLLWRRSSIMILDEPTAMLSPADSDGLFESLRNLARGGATILLVTHRLPEVMEHCEQVTVLRAGRLVADVAVADTNAQELAEMIVGHAIAPPPGRRRAESSATILRLDGIRATGDRGDEALKDVSFQIREGEIVGIAGVDGSGQRELFRVLMGLQKVQAGVVLFEGTDLRGYSPAQRIRLGIRLLPEDRHEEGVVEDWPLIENAALGLHRLPRFSNGALIDVRSRAEGAQEIAERFSTRHGGLDMPMRSLSGGNQQRFVAARTLLGEPRLVLAFQPARGLDIDGTRQVYEALREEGRRGCGSLVVSFDLDELLENCDRCLVMNGGRVFEPAKGKELDRTEIGRLMVGVT